MRPFLFDSWCDTYKKPFGAVPADTRVTFTFPVAETLNATAVTLIARGFDGNALDTTVALRQDKRTKIEGYTVFKGVLCPKTAGVLFYRFEVEAGDKTYFCGKGEYAEAVSGDWLPEWQLTVYDQGFVTPDWLKGGTIYHVFADRFCHVGEDILPKYGVLKQWDEELTVVDPDGVYRANDFYGGNFKGIVSKLPYLKSLSVTAIYLSPIFESSSNHRYDTADYLKIDPVLGTEEDFCALLSEAEKLGIYIILDGVFNHTGADSLYFNKFGHYPEVGAYQSKKSKYHNWYTFTDFPNTYDCWWGVTVVPTVRRDAIGYQNLIAGKNGVLEKWTKLGVRGWRLDVVDELSHAFVDKIRASVKAVDSDAVVIGEVWEDASTKISYDEKRKYLLGAQLDGVMNYPFRNAILNYLREGDGNAFKKDVMQVIENYPKQALDVSMSLIGTHDTVRAINAVGDTWGAEFTKPEKLDFLMSKSQYIYARQMLKLAAALQYILPGVPSLYYGDEIGMQGFDDPINRRPFSAVWDMDILSHYRALGAVRAAHKKDLQADIKIEVQDDVLIIKRGALRLLVNRTAQSVAVKPVLDLLSNTTVSTLKARSAIVWEE